MKHKYIYISFLVLTLFFVSCNKLNDNSVKKYRIDFDKSNPLKEFVKHTELIKLETNESSLIRDISKVEFYKKYIYVFDLSQNIIVIFNQDGKYKNTINNVGQGPKEYLNINDFGINIFSDQLYILDAIKQLLFYYDLQGNLVEIKKLPKLTEGSYFSLQFCNTNTILFWTSDDKNRLKVMDCVKNSFTLESFPKKEHARMAYLFSDSLFMEEMSNLVYSFDEGKIKEKYRIDIASLSPELKSKEIFKSFDNKSYITFINKLINSENIDYVIKYINENSKFILISFYRKSVYYTYIINKETGSFYSFSNIDKNFIPFIKYMNNDFLVGVYESDFEYMYKSIINPIDMDILNNISEECNPVLIKYYMNNDNGYYGLLVPPKLKL